MIKRFIFILFFFGTATGCYIEKDIQVTCTVVTVTYVKKLDRVYGNDSERCLITLEGRDNVKYYMFYYDGKVKVGDKFTVLMRN